MRYEIVFLIAFLTSFLNIFSNASAEGSHMDGYYDDGVVWKNIYPVKSPIRVKIQILNTPEEIQKYHKIDLAVEYTNPKSSNETGLWNTRLTERDIGLFSEEKIIGRAKSLPTEPKPRPLNDNDFIKVEPGEQKTWIWTINLLDREMLEGTHTYNLFLAGNHTLESFAEKIAIETNYTKHALTIDTKSNTLSFIYTK